MNTRLLIIPSICQVITGIVIIGLAASIFHSLLDQAIYEFQRIYSFGIILIGVIIFGNGIVGIATAVCCAGNKLMNIMYMIITAVSTTVSCALIYGFAVEVRVCIPSLDNASSNRYCPADIFSAVLAFGVLSSAISVVGVIMAAIALYKRMK